MVPSYNSAKYLPRLFQSIINQNYFNIEIVLVDDGSTDDTASVVNRWRDSFSHVGVSIQYIYQSNQGPGAAVNTALKHINGEYTVWIDTDDAFAPSSIESRLKIFAANPDIDYIRSGVQMFDDSTLEVLSDYTPKGDAADIFSDLISHRQAVLAPSWMVRTAALDQFLPNRRSIYPSRHGQNWQLTLPLTYNGRGFIDPHVVAMIAVREGSHSRTAQGNKSEIARIDGLEDIMSTVLTELNITDSDTLRATVIAFAHMRFEIALKYRDCAEARRQYSFLIANGAKRSAQILPVVKSFLPRKLTEVLKQIRKGFRRGRAA